MAATAAQATGRATSVRVPLSQKQLAGSRAAHPNEATRLILGLRERVLREAQQLQLSHMPQTPWGVALEEQHWAVPRL